MLHHLFQPVSEVEKLANYVKNAKYAKAADIIKNQPELMFEKIMVNGKSISPLQLALNLLDTYMWKTIFQKQIQHEPKWMASFWQQVQEQNEYFSLDNLLQAYQNYDNWNEIHLKDLQAENVKISLKQAWLNIGKAQRELPHHIINELFRYCKTAYSAEKLKVSDSPPPVCDLYAVGKYSHGLLGLQHEEIKILPFKPQVGLGYDYTLEVGMNIVIKTDRVRAVYNGCFDTLTGATHRIWRYDQAFFHDLYEVRRSEYIELQLLANQALDIPSAKVPKKTPV